MPLGGKSDVDKEVIAARKAFPVWSKKPQAERSQIAMKIAGLNTGKCRGIRQD